MKRKLLLLALTMFMIPMMIFAQMNCLYVSTIADPGALESEYFITKFTEWGYNLVIIAPGDLALYFEEDLAPYDFIFIDEIIGSSSIAPANFLLEPAIVPVVLTENYAIRANTMGWCNNSQATNIGAEPVLIMNAELSGLEMGSMATLNSGGGANEDLIPNLPEIDFIPVAQSTSMSDLFIAVGIEAGTVSVNGVTILNRCASIGYHANGYAAITDDGYTLLKSMIEWVTGGGTAVETADAPDQYRLSQNYPNPFNPETSINFNLTKAGQTTVTVFNSLGQTVTELVNDQLPAGSHHVTFRADNLQSGVYYYKIQSGEFSEMKKMLLLK
ncbi:T9SS type A sorting domain-containing protein [bacterium]|nr:T9SS type A sorting domain-containing protein [bacterium]